MMFFKDFIGGIPRLTCSIPLQSRITCTPCENKNPVRRNIGRVRNHPLNRSGRYTAVRVMVDKWESYSNRGTTSRTKSGETGGDLKQVTELLDRINWSPRRPLLTHRSYWLVNQMTLEICIDYRSLNDCTQSASWPIPNIKEMFADSERTTQILWCYGLNRGISPGTGQPGDAGILAFICFAFPVL
jgi:hypothetical protein